MAYKILIHGDFLVYSSLSQINFMIGKLLLDRGYDVYFYQHPDKPIQNHSVEAQRLQERRIYNVNEWEYDLVIYHQYPLKVENPSKNSIAIVPWEYSSIPKEWERKLSFSDVSELWVPSNFVKNTLSPYFPPDNIIVVPNGYDPSIFSPVGKKYSFQTEKTFKFLFVGGTLLRKGIDLLLQAYTDVFSENDDVSLIIKDFFYSKNNDLIQQYQIPGAPEIVYHYENVDMQTISDMYRSAQCLVHPFRAEGFGMPMLEAIASQLPVIATSYGPVSDFMSENTSFLIPSTLSPAYGDAFLKTCVQNPLWANPDVTLLKKTMRYVFEHQDEAKRKAKKAVENIKNDFHWEKILDQVENRILEKFHFSSPTLRQKLVLYQDEFISPKNKKNCASLIESNKNFSYTTLVLSKFSDFHSSCRRSVRLSGEPIVKNSEIVVESSLPAHLNEKELLRGFMSDKNNKLFYLLDLISFHINNEHFPTAIKYINSISKIDSDANIFLKPFYLGVVFEKKGLYEEAVNEFKEYLQLSMYDDFSFRKKYVLAFLKK